MILTFRPLPAPLPTWKDTYATRDHPDRGGDPDEFVRLTAARDLVKAVL